MPSIVQFRDDIQKYLQKHGLAKKWEKAKKLFEKEPSHPSLNTELLEPKHRLIYSFRLNKKYRAIFICLPEDKVEIIAVTNHYRK
jgi:Txe/YoeB family toxin of Txe-Axe toxin-antitoxin module